MASQQGVIGTWLVGTGIIVYRIIARQHRPPVPGELLGSSGLFVMLALLAIGAPTLAVTIGVGVDIAAFMNLAGSGVIGTALSGPSGSQSFTPVPPTQVSPESPPTSSAPYGGWWPTGNPPAGSQQPFGGWWPWDNSNAPTSPPAGGWWPTGNAPTSDAPYGGWWSTGSAPSSQPYGGWFPGAGGGGQGGPFAGGGGLGDPYVGV